MFTCFSCYSLQLVFSCSSAGSNAVFIPSSIGKTGYSTISTINSYGMSSTNCYAIIQGDTIICYISFSISSCIKLKVVICRYTCAFSIYGINGVSVGCSCFTYRSDVGTLNYLCLSCVQLAYVYCVISVNTICYAGNLAIVVNGNLVVKLDAAICKADAACAFACAGDGSNTCQSIFQRNANFITNIAYLNIIIAIKFNCSARCYNRFSTASSFQLPTLVGISSSFTYLLQLCNVYSISIFSTCCYIGNRLIIRIEAVFANIRLIADRQTRIGNLGVSCRQAVFRKRNVFTDFDTVGIHLRVASSNATQLQIILQADFVINTTRVICSC